MDIKGEFSCELCGKKYTGEDNIVMHNRRCGDTTVRKCQICEKDFVGQIKFQNHKAVHQKKNCKFCNILIPKNSHQKHQKKCNKDSIELSCDQSLKNQRMR